MSCGFCGASCMKHSGDINASKSGKVFCTIACATKFSLTKERVKLPCGNCGKECVRREYEFKQSKSGKIFCNRSCSVTYNNKHKKFGTKVSKLETYLAEELVKLYSFEFHFNKKDEIDSELDIYIPTLKLAFELNGIFHYEPIFGSKKLEQIQINDKNKFQACQARQISLCVIDSSTMTKFKPNKGKKFLSIICSIIDTHLSELSKNQQIY